MSRGLQTIRELADWVSIPRLSIGHQANEMEVERFQEFVSIETFGGKTVQLECHVDPPHLGSRSKP